MTKPETNALEFCKSTIKGFKSKSDHNKDEALRCFLVVMIFTLLAPLFITLGEGFWWGKVVPSLLSVGAAFSTAWLQLRKPQQLWSLYRSCQRELEDQLTKYEYGLGEYKDNEEADSILASKVAEIAMKAHEKWLPIVPNPEGLKEAKLEGQNEQ